MTKDGPLSVNVFAQSVSPTGTMGGNTRILIEFMKRWAKSSDLLINVFTSEKCYETFRSYKLHDLPNVKYIICSSKRMAMFGTLIAQQLQIVNGCLTALRVPNVSRRVGSIAIYSASAYLDDIIPAIILKKKWKGSKWIASDFLPWPNPLRKKSSYGVNFEIPRLKTLAGLFLSSIRSFLFNFADGIFVTNEIDRDRYIRRGFKDHQLYAAYGGVDLEEIKKVKGGGHVYDGCFVGRVHPQKGVLGLIEIWDNVSKVKPGSRLALIGNGPKDYENRVRMEITRRRLQGNIDMLGYVDGVQKYAILRSSKVFLHTSVYDNSGMTAAEAMACGVPVVRFDIPTLEVAYPKGTLVAPLLDYSKFAELVLTLLTNPSLHSKMKEQAEEAAKGWDWNKRSKEVLEFIESLVGETI